jgi:CBS domain-containing protein
MDATFIRSMDGNDRGAKHLVYSVTGAFNMNHAKDIMTTDFVTVTPETSVADIAKVLLQKITSARCLSSTRVTKFWEWLAKATS